MIMQTHNTVIVTCHYW